jgi:hypothetical protein
MFFGFVYLLFNKKTKTKTKQRHKQTTSNTKYLQSEEKVFLEENYFLLPW